jgi:exodeoxyribonuclease VII large subunit
MEELWSFNEESVANAIFESDVPIITGVGHETDFTISDFVADHRAPTPSAAAEIAVKSKEEIRLMINKSLQSIMLQVNRKVELKATKLERFSEKMMAGLVKRYTDRKVQSMEHFHGRTINAAKNFSAMERSRLQAYGTQLSALSPLNVLSRGYGIVSKGEHVMISIEQLAQGDHIAIQFVDGKATGTIDSVEKSLRLQESEAEHGSKEK